MANAMPFRGWRRLRSIELSPVWLNSAYAAAYAVILLCFCMAWGRRPELLYVGRDGSYGLWVADAYRHWAGVFDITAINPYQGMVSTLIPINPYFDPAQWVFWLHWPYGAQALAAYSIYFVEVTASTFALGRTLGFSRAFSFVGAIWLALLLFPPFNFVLALQGFLATAPFYGHLLALSNLILIAFAGIGGTGSANSTIVGRALGNLVLAAVMLVLAVWALLVAPFYDAGMLLGSALLGGVILLSSSSRGQFLWRGVCGLLVLAGFYGLGLRPFYAAEMAFSNRLTTLRPEIHWPVDLSGAAIAKARAVWCSLGVVCDAFPGWPSHIGSYWIHAAVIGGAIALWRRAPKPLSRIGLFGGSVWLILLLIWVVVGLDAIALPFSASYFFLMYYPLLAFLSLYGMLSLIRLGVPRSAYDLIAGRELAIETAAVLAAAIGMLVLGSTVHAFAHNFATVARYSRPLPSTPIVELLKQQVSFRPGTLYRGSVATIFGAPHGTFRPVLGLSPTQPLHRGQIEEFRRLAAETGSSDDLLDLWRWKIPTLSEYGQGVSRQLMFYASHFLSSAGDPPEIDFEFPRLINIDVLRAMGVRFIVTDTNVAKGAILRSTAAVTDGATLYLYELADPNLGTYSPTRLRRFVTPSEFAIAVHDNADIFETMAFVDRPDPTALTPASNAQLTFEKGGMHVTAQGGGRSALLLPVQFSHCYKLTAPPDQAVLVERADLLFTLVVFQHKLDARLRWHFGFPGNSACRVRDVDDLRAMGLS